MINVSALVQLKAFARIDGAWLALLWVASFACIIYLPQSMAGSLLMFATPLFVAWRLFKFRNDALDGTISFRRAFAYGCYTFFYASLLFAVAQYLYFAYLDGGRFGQMLEEALQTIEPMYKQSGIDTQEARETLKLMAQLSPIEKAFVFMVQNLSIGLFLSMTVAVVGMKKPRTNQYNR